MGRRCWFGIRTRSASGGSTGRTRRSVECQASTIVATKVTVDGSTVTGIPAEWFRRVMSESWRNRLQWASRSFEQLNGVIAVGRHRRRPRSSRSPSREPEAHPLPLVVATGAGADCAGAGVTTWTSGRAWSTIGAGTARCRRERWPGRAAHDGGDARVGRPDDGCDRRYRRDRRQGCKRDRRVGRRRARGGRRGGLGHAHRCDEPEHRRGAEPGSDDPSTDCRMASTWSGRACCCRIGCGVADRAADGAADEAAGTNGGCGGPDGGGNVWRRSGSKSVIVVGSLVLVRVVGLVSVVVARLVLVVVAGLGDAGDPSDVGLLGVAPATTTGSVTSARSCRQR